MSRVWLVRWREPTKDMSLNRRRCGAHSSCKGNNTPTTKASEIGENVKIQPHAKRGPETGDYAVFALPKLPPRPRLHKSKPAVSDPVLGLIDFHRIPPPRSSWYGLLTDCMFDIRFPKFRQPFF